MQHNSASDIRHLESLARLIRFHCLNMTSRAQSGHLTSSLSAADLMTALVFGGRGNSTAPPYMADMWRYDGTFWREVTGISMPPARWPMKRIFAVF